MSGARELWDRRLRLLAAGDLAGLLGQYHDDAVLLRFDREVRGRDALREYLGGWLAGRPVVRDVLELAVGEDVVSFHLLLERGGEELRTHGALFLRGERIAREVGGLFPAAGAGAARRGTVHVDLEPYTAWTPRPVPDPRSAGREAIGPVLLEIVGAEGPILAERAYRLYVKASGGKALTSIARAPLSGAVYRLRQAGAIDFDENAGVLRPAGAAEVRVRELGPRALDEVPMGEVVELMRRLRDAGASELPRAVLDAYGLVRMTAKAEAFLSDAESLLD